MKNPVQVHVQVGHELAGSSLLRHRGRRAETDLQTVLRQEEKREFGGTSHFGSVLPFRRQHQPGPSRITPITIGVDPGDLDIPPPGVT